MGGEGSDLGDGGTVFVELHVFNLPFFPIQTFNFCSALVFIILSQHNMKSILKTSMWFLW